MDRIRFDRYAARLARIIDARYPPIMIREGARLVLLAAYSNSYWRLAWEMTKVALANTWHWYVVRPFLRAARED